MAMSFGPDIRHESFVKRQCTIANPLIECLDRMNDHLCVAVHGGAGVHDPSIDRELKKVLRQCVLIQILVCR
jgi:hypothetical protein